MRAFFRSPFIAAFIGGAVVAAALLALGVSGKSTTKTVVQQSPVASRSSAATTSSQLTAHDIYQRAAPGVAFVRSQITQDVPSPFNPFGGGQSQQQGEATGSGFVIDTQGRILTNYHVIAGASKITVSFEDKQTVDATVVGKDPSTDLALLKVDPSGLKLSPLTLGDSSTAEVGDPVLAIGNPFGLDRTLTTGVVSALQRHIQAPSGFSIDHVIQTDAAINPGNSGGPLLDAAGRVIGINSQIATGGSGASGASGGNVGIGFAVPIDTAKQILSSLEHSGTVQHAYMGIDGRTIDNSLASLNLAAKRGVLVEQATPGGPAAKAGIQGGNVQGDIGGSTIMLGGDVIEKIDGKQTDTIDQLIALVNQHKPGEKVEVQLLRSGATKTIQVTLANRPSTAPTG
jgi:S1-C subfamily serine protease